MQAELINDWWITTDSGGSMGTTNTSGITDKQKHNAQKVFDHFNNLGWSLSAISGMIGNMQLESWLSPGLIQGTHRSYLPNHAASLSDVPNSVMLNFYDSHYGLSGGGFGIGLVQWDGYTATNPSGQKLVSFAIRYNMNWYDGDTQLYRIERECETNIQWQPATINGTYWTWDKYIHNNETPETSAKIWRICYEVAAAGTDQTRQENARYWYEYFYDSPTPTPPGPSDDWIYGTTFAQYALNYDGEYLPYSEYDCIGFVNLVWRDIQIVFQNNWNLTNGTNSIWRSTRTFNTTDPNGISPTLELWYKDTIANCISTYGEIPAGALLFHQIGEDGPPPIPSQYRGDGIGNFVHVGIYCGNNEVMQSGGRDSGSVPGGGVHKSAYDPGAWNYVAFVVWVDPVSSEPGPGPGPEPPTPTPHPYFKTILFWYGNKKEVLGHVKKLI